MALLNFVSDKTGFPMIWAGEIGAYIHWLPVTKVQFEYFLCDAPGAQFDEQWYNSILGLNERVTPKRAARSNYWQLFLTGILPSEAVRFAEWCGDEYRLPTPEEWKRAYQAFQSISAMDPLVSDPGLNERTRTIVIKLDEISKGIARSAINARPRTLTDQMLMRFGVMEWVQYEQHGQRWGGMGQTDSSFQSVMRKPDADPETPREPEQHRLRQYGFRLLRR
jgi:hypothetical protein